MLRNIPFKSSIRSYSNQSASITTAPTVFLTNVRAISNKLDEVTLSLRTHKPDIAVITETWLDNTTPISISISISIQGYNIARLDRNSRGGGILIYVADNLSFNVLDLHSIPNISRSESEILPVIIDGSLLVVCLYHPFWNDSHRDSECISSLIDIIDYTLTNIAFDPSRFKCLICGDFNGLRSHYVDIQHQTGLTPIVTAATRGCNILDQIFTDIPLMSNPVILPPIARSDHCIVLWRQSRFMRNKSVKRRIRIQSKARRAQFNDLICRYDWLALVNSTTNVNEAAQILLESLKSLYDLCFPLRTVRIRPSDPPWVTGNLRHLINQRDRAFQQKQMPKYLRIREEVISHTRFLKCRYLKMAISSGNVRNAWKAIKSVGRYTHSTSTFISPQISAEDFNSYFESIFQNGSNCDFETVCEEASIPTFDVCEIDSILKRLRRKSCGPDELPYWIFREYSYLLSPAITSVFNASLMSGIVPMCFKKANVVPVPKCTRPSLASDYRQISLLPILSKVLEKLVCQKFILPPIQSNLDLTQFAYVPSRASGTVSALTLLSNRILQFLDSSSGAVRILTLDFSKAFDKVLHNVILSAALKLELPYFIVRWIGSFLSGRMQRVKMGTMFSSWTFVPSGVPQGSVLGPILFGMVMESFRPLCSNSAVIKYADDLTIMHFIRSSSENRLQAEWQHCVDWSNDNHLPLNISKCKVLDIVTKRQLVTDPIVTLDGFVIPNVDELKILGVIFASNLKWNAHIRYVVSKASRRIFLIRNLKRSDCPDMLTFNAYVAFLRSVLLYAYPSFCNLPFYLQQQLLNVEKRVFRIMNSNANRENILNVADRSCVKLFRKIELYSDHPLRAMFQEREVVRTRNSLSLKPPPTKTERFKNSFVKYCRRW